VSIFSWISQVAELGSAVLTAQAQTVSPTDVDRLLWPTIFPRRDVNSIRLANIAGSIDYRPVADRREWNQRGREIPLITPDISAVEMIPIEAKFGINEREITLLREQAFGNEATFRAIVGTSITDRITGLAKANFRRIELDAFQAWALGQIVLRDPQGGAADETVSLGFAVARYVTPAAWTGGAAGTAYAQLLAQLELAQELTGSVAGVMLRLTTFKAIQESSPRPVNSDNVALTRSQLKDRVEQDTGRPFQFLINEDSADVFSDGGTTTARTKIWPANRVGFMPDGFQIGNTAFAPVSRAWDLAAQIPGGGIDIRGNTVYAEEANNGRSLSVECQVNALSVPDEQKVYVVNAGI